MRVRVKICGLTTSEAVDAAVEAGADALGFVFAESPRAVTPDRALKMAIEVPPFVLRVAVFHHPTAKEAKEALSRFAPDLIQSDAEELARFPATFRSKLLPVFRDREGEEQRVDDYLAESGRARPVILFEGPVSGTGVPVDWSRAAALARKTRLVLAGGLDPDNVGEAIARVRPFGVDVSTGVESDPGEKDADRIVRFLAAVRRAEAALAAARGPS